MAILDTRTLARLLNRRDAAAYNPDYLSGVIADAADQITGYLGYDPVLQVVSGEEGAVDYVQSGVYVGRYALSLAHAPLIPGDASAIFSSLQLTYGLATLPASGVDFTSVTLLHRIGRAFTLAPGAVEALTWQYGLTPGVRAVGYIASYVAGYATGINDPTLPGNVSYNAQPIPAALTQAAVLLCRERLAMDDAQNADTANVSAGSLASVKTADQALSYRGMVAGGCALGYGTPLSQAAATRLNQYRRLALPMFI